MLGFGPFCLDLGHIAWIWAIWQNLGQNRPQRRRNPEDGAGGTDVQTDGCMDGRTDSPVFYRTSSPSGPLPKKIVKDIENTFYSIKIPKLFNKIWIQISYYLL